MNFFPSELDARFLLPSATESWSFKFPTEIPVEVRKRKVEANKTQNEEELALPPADSSTPADDTSRRLCTLSPATYHNTTLFALHRGED